MTVTCLIGTRHVTNCNHELDDLRHRFFPIAYKRPGGNGLVFSRSLQPIREHVQLPRRYKPSPNRLPTRIPHFQNATTSLLSTTTLNTMPPARTFNNRSFYPFPIDYSSESFAPLVHSDRQISHVKYLLRGNHTAVARFRHYLTTCLEKAIADLQTSRDHVFDEFITPDVVQRLQPFLIQTRRRSQAPPSTAIINNIRRQQDLPPIPTFPTPPPTTAPTTQPTPTIRLPHASHDNVPIVVPTSNPTPVNRHPDTPIPPPLVPPPRYVSSLLPTFNPCPSCGSADDTHYHECTL